MPAVSNRFARSFPGVPETDRVPVPRTIRNFRELPVSGGLMDEFHGILDNHVSTHGFPPSNETIVTPTPIESLGRRNMRKENEAVGRGRKILRGKTTRQRTHKDCVARTAPLADP